MYVRSVSDARLIAFALTTEGWPGLPRLRSGIKSSVFTVHIVYDPGRNVSSIVVQLFSMNVGKTLHIAIKTSGMSVSDLARAIGIERTTVSNFLHEIRELDPRNELHKDFVQRTCEVLHLRAEDIWATWTPKEQKTQPSAHGMVVARILLDTLCDPNAPEDRKTEARTVIEGWLSQIF